MQWKASLGGMRIDLTYCMLSCSALPHRPRLSDSSEIIVTVWNELVCQMLVTRRKSMCIYWNPDTSALEKTLSKIRTQKQMSTMTCQRPISRLLDALWLLEVLKSYWLVCSWAKSTTWLSIISASITITGVAYTQINAQIASLRPRCETSLFLPKHCWVDIEVKSQTAVNVLTTYGVPHEVPDLPVCCVTMFKCFVCVCRSSACDTTFQAFFWYYFHCLKSH